MPDEKYVEELAKKLPQGTDKTPEVLEEALKGLPDKWVWRYYFYLKHFANWYFANNSNL